MKRLLILFLLLVSCTVFAGEDAGLAGAAYVRAIAALSQAQASAAYLLQSVASAAFLTQSAATSTYYPCIGGTVSGPSTFSSTLGVTGTSTFNQQIYGPDGSTAAPSFSFSSAPLLGMWKNGATTVAIGKGTAYITVGNYMLSCVSLAVGVQSPNKGYFDPNTTASSTSSTYGWTSANFTKGKEGLGRYAEGSPSMSTVDGATGAGVEAQRWTATQTLLLQKPVLTSLASATIDALSAVVAGSMVFNTGSTKAQVFDGTYWRDCW